MIISSTGFHTLRPQRSRTLGSRPLRLPLNLKKVTKDGPKNPGRQWPPGFLSLILRLRHPCNQCEHHRTAQGELAQVIGSKPWLWVHFSKVEDCA